VQPIAAGLAIARQTVTVKKNVAAVKVECPAAATAGCKGTLALLSGKVKVGSARYSLAAGKRGVVKVKLAKAARKLIARKRKLKATATATDVKAAITLKLPSRRR
jgi:virginiamycin B lyase